MKILAAISILGWASLCTVLAIHYWPKPERHISAYVPLTNPWMTPGEVYRCQVANSGQSMYCNAQEKK